MHQFPPDTQEAFSTTIKHLFENALQNEQGPSTLIRGKKDVSKFTRISVDGLKGALLRNFRIT